MTTVSEIKLQHQFFDSTKITLKPQHNNTSEERRGRPESTKNVVKNDRKHYVTIWQAELNYVYVVSGSSKGYASEKHQEIDIQKLIPEEHKGMYRKIVEVDANKRNKRLDQMLTKLAFARSYETSKQFFEIYFKVISLVVRKEFEKPTQTRQECLKEIMEQLLLMPCDKIKKTDLKVDIARQRKQFAKLLRVIAHSIIATYENDEVIKNLNEF